MRARAIVRKHSGDLRTEPKDAKRLWRPIGSTLFMDAIRQFPSRRKIMSAPGPHRQMDWLRTDRLRDALRERVDRNGRPALDEREIKSARIVIHLHPFALPFHRSPRTLARHDEFRPRNRPSPFESFLPEHFQYDGFLHGSDYRNGYLTIDYEIPTRGFPKKPQSLSGILAPFLKNLLPKQPTKTK